MKSLMKSRIIDERGIYTIYMMMADDCLINAGHNVTTHKGTVHTYYWGVEPRVTFTILVLHLLQIKGTWEISSYELYCIKIWAKAVTKNIYILLWDKYQYLTINY